MPSRPATRVRVLLGAIVAIGALVLLAAGVSDVEFSAGYRLAPDPLAGDALFRLPQDLLDALLAILFLVAPILMLVGVLYALAASGFRARALLWFLWTALMVAGLYYVLRLYPALFQHLPRIEGPPEAAVATPAATVVAQDLGEFDARPPDWAEPVAVVGLALLVSAIVVAGAWALVQRFSARKDPIEDLAVEARRALDALRAGADVRDTVMRCYFEMGRVLDEYHGLVRQEAMTPREFEQALARVDLPRAQVEQLTRLFERVRYGSHPATEAQQQVAIACLSAIAAAARPDRRAPVEGRL